MVYPCSCNFHWNSRKLILVHHPVNSSRLSLVGEKQIVWIMKNAIFQILKLAPSQPIILCVIWFESSVIILWIIKFLLWNVIYDISIGLLLIPKVWAVKVSVQINFKGDLKFLLSEYLSSQICFGFYLHEFPRSLVLSLNGGKFHVIRSYW